MNAAKRKRGLGRMPCPACGRLIAFRPSGKRWDHMCSSACPDCWKLLGKGREWAEVHASSTGHRTVANPKG